MVLAPILLGELVLGFMISHLLVRLAHRYHFTDKPDTNLKTHGQETPHVGGLIILITAAIAYIIIQWGRVDYSFKQLVELAALVLLFEIGMIDDTRHVAVGWRLVMHIQIAIALLVAGNVFEPFPWRWANYTITILGIITCINAINLLDIMDGLAGGVSLFVIAGLCYTYVARGIQSFYIVIGLVIIAAIIPFLISNFRPPPHKSFLGDSGSTMLGLLIAILFLNSTQLVPHVPNAETTFPFFPTPFRPPDILSEAGVGTALVFISIPLFEIFFVSTMRLLQKRNPFKGSPDHFPLRLLKLVGTPHRAILIIYGWCALIMAGGIVIFYAATIFKIIAAVIIGLTFITAWIALARVQSNP